MNKQRWKKIETIVDTALRINHSKSRKLYIERACKNDDLLFQEITSLIEAIRKAEESNFMGQ